MVAVMIHSRPDIGAFDMNSRVEAVKGRDGEFAHSRQGEEGAGEAGSHSGVERNFGIEFFKESLNKGQCKRFPLGLL